MKARQVSCDLTYPYCDRGKHSTFRVPLPACWDVLQCSRAHYSNHSNHAEVEREYHKRERERRKLERQDPVKMAAERKRNTIARRTARASAREKQRKKAIERSRTRMKKLREEGRKHFKAMSDQDIEDFLDKFPRNTLHEIDLLKNGG
jgi:hypothetical protein